MKKSLHQFSGWSSVPILEVTGDSERCYSGLYHPVVPALFTSARLLMVLYVKSSQVCQHINL